MVAVTDHTAFWFSSESTSRCVSVSRMDNTEAVRPKCEAGNGDACLNLGFHLLGLGNDYWHTSTV